MIPQQLKPSMVFTPAKPPKRVAPQEEGVPLHRIDRRLWPGMRTVRNDGQGKPQAGRAAEIAELDGPEIPACVPAAGAAEHASRTTDSDPCVSASLRENPPEPGATSIPNLNPNPNLNPAPDPVSSTERNRGGRPRAITPQRRTQLLHILRRGQSRRHAAMRMGIDAATITRAIRRDPRLALEVVEAEEEGQMFLEIWDRLYSLQATTLELQPVVSTPQLEREKEYLIRCGLPAEYVRRLRQRTMDDPPPPDLPPELSEDNQRHREIRVRPWKKGWRKKRASALEREDLWW